MKIAVPVAEGELSVHFGQSTHFAMFEVDDETRAVRGREDLAAPRHEPGVFPKWLAEQGVRTVLAGGMGSKAKDLFAENGITVVTGVGERGPAEAVEAYLADSLTTVDNFCEK